MKDGFIKVAAGSVNVTVADTQMNKTAIIQKIKEAHEAGVNLLVLPELCVTGCTCGDLFYNERLLDGAMTALKEICVATEDLYPVVVLGIPVRYQNKLFNCSAVICQGNILGLVPAYHVTEKQFVSGAELSGNECVLINGEEIPFGMDLLFQHEELSQFCFGVELADDFYSPTPRSVDLTASGATIITIPAACPELVGTAEFRRLQLKAASAKLNCGCIYSEASSDESTQDVVYSGHALIAENGDILIENKPFDNNLVITEIDLQQLITDRQKNHSFESNNSGNTVIFFMQEIHLTALTRCYDPNPFLPKADLAERAESILEIQANGLKKRLSHTYAKRAVIGISGGLDSTLALLVAVRSMKLLNRPTSDILAITMPCFGTSSRTKNNAVTLCKELGVELKEVNIAASVLQHFKDIDQDENNLDVTFENGQARERTQVLMDIANQCGGLVIGTGDLSELALGWATYNGDHMSMYGVNADVPKTLVRNLVHHEAEAAPKALKETLLDILDTPVSPELLPLDKNGEMTQKTEDLVGPYELHDFYLYYFVRFGFTPKKLLRLAKYVLGDKFDEATLTHWLKTFLRRFFNQQFKRSCLPDGPKVGTVSLSPRGDWQMPSDASSALWLNELE